MTMEMAQDGGKAADHSTADIQIHHLQKLKLWQNRIKHLKNYKARESALAKAKL